MTPYPKSSASLKLLSQLCDDNRMKYERILANLISEKVKIESFRTRYHIYLIFQSPKHMRVTWLDFYDLIKWFMINWSKNLILTFLISLTQFHLPRSSTINLLIDRIILETVSLSYYGIVIANEQSFCYSLKLKNTSCTFISNFH